MADRLLVVDDDANECAAFEMFLGQLGFEVTTTTDPREALRLAECQTYDAILTDLAMPGMSGLALCEQLLAKQPHVPMLLITGHASVETVSQAMRTGVRDYLQKPLDTRQLTVRLTRALCRATVETELTRVHAEAGASSPEPALRGRSAAMRDLRRLIERVGASEASVLIHGETGTGKELVARSVHAASLRQSGPFVALNCAAVPAGLLESELFGHVRGAFTDAKMDRLGLFAQAHGGTLLLDEIGELTLDMQAKLLRALQERRVRPVGGAREVECDVRVLAATHKQLEAEVARGAFREDLFYRIQVVQIEVPALRVRGGDILELAAVFLAQHAQRTGEACKLLTPRVAELLLQYEWPGNVRELENAMEHAATLGRFDRVLPEDLPEAVRQELPAVTSRAEERLMTVDELERVHVRRVLALVNGNKSRASELLGIDRRTLRRKLGRGREPERHGPA